MRIPTNEFLPAQMGASPDPMINQNLIEGSKESPFKRGSRMLIGFLLVLVVLAGAITLYGVLFPRQVDFARVERDFVQDMVSRQLPDRMYISRLEACYLNETYYYTVDFRIGDDPKVEQHVYHGFSGVDGWFDLESAPQELRSDYDRAREEGEQRVYTQAEIDNMLASIYEHHEKKGHLE